MDFYDSIYIWSGFSEMVVLLFCLFGRNFGKFI